MDKKKSKDDFETLVARMDRTGSYFWYVSKNGIRLINTVTYKTAIGVQSKSRAQQLTSKLRWEGFQINDEQIRMEAKP